MLRLSIFTVLLASCGVDADGQPIFCFHPDCGVESEEPVSFTFDRGLHQEFASIPTVARGGQLRVDVTGFGERPVVTEQSETISMTTTGAGATSVRLTVHARTPGTGSITGRLASTQESRAIEIRVAELESIGIALPREAPSDHLLVLPDIRQLAIYPRGGGHALIDHALVLAPSTPPGFTMPRWDVLSIPKVAGDYRVTFRHGEELHDVEIRVLDQIDDIVARRLELIAADAGTLCVDPIADGEVVKTGAFTYTGTPGLELGNRTTCVDFSGATPGSTITVEVGGISKDFPIVDAPL